MRLGLIATLMMLAGGCNTVTLTDDVDIELNFFALLGPSDLMHVPYVAGSSCSIYVHSSDSRTSMDAWTIESSDPTVLKIEQQTHTDDRFNASVRTFKEGDVTLTVRDRDRNVVHQRLVPVRLPDRIDLLAHGLLLIQRGEDEARIAEARIRATGTATYLARYYRDGQQLYGNGALSVDAHPDVNGRVVRSFLFENRDWLQITPERTGSFDLVLNAAGEPIHGLHVEAVPDSDVTSIRIIGVDESRAREKQWLVALAQGYDAENRAVYGVEYEWQLDGANQTGQGDLYRYTYNPETPRVLEAQFGGMDAQALIRGKGFVDSTNRVGCAYAGGRAPAPVALFAFGAFALAAALRCAVRRGRGPGRLTALRRGRARRAG